jgi:hypothetical protein
MAATREVFVYGTLMFPSVLLVLLGRLPEARRATLQGFARKRVRDKAYPALVAIAPGSSSAQDESPPAVQPVAFVPGLLLTLVPHELNVLEWYEGDEYELLPVEVLAPADDPLDDHSPAGPGSSPRRPFPCVDGPVTPFGWATTDSSATAGAPGDDRGGDGSGGGGSPPPAWVTGAATVARVAATTYAWRLSSLGAADSRLEPDEWAPGVFAPHEAAFVAELVAAVAGEGACP